MRLPSSAKGAKNSNGAVLRSTCALRMAWTRVNLPPMAHPTKVTEAAVKKRLAAIEYAQGSIAHLAPGRNLADELIADRRAETCAEESDAGAD